MNSSHGISCLNGAEATVRGCLIANNEGGGVCVGKNSRIRMFENLIALNTRHRIHGQDATEKRSGVRFAKLAYRRRRFLFRRGKRKKQ